MKHTSSTITWVLVVLCIVNALLVIHQLFRDKSVAKNEQTFSYIGMDYPPEYPIGPLDAVSMTLQESVHFSLNASDPSADAEWNLINAIPKGIGRTRLGPDHRVFVLTFLHQMHCLRRIQLALLDRNDSMASPGHVNHCLNYLRQTILCEAAVSLEEGDFMGKDYDEERVGSTLVCKDWMAAIAMFDQQYEDWVKWRKVWN